MNKISFYGIAATLALSALLLSSCDQDFTEIGSGIVDEDHFAFRPDTTSTVRAYTQSTGVVQSNNLPINSLGIYQNAVFGKVKANFVTQLELGTLNPIFSADKNPVLDSVVLTIPYFSTRKSEADNKFSYTLDSLQGAGAINLKVYESGYVLNNLDPNDNFQTQQIYFTDLNSDINSNKRGTLLNNAADVKQNTAFEPSNKEVVKFKLDRALNPIVPAEVEARTAPRMRLKLDKAFFQQKIIDAPAGRLLTDAAFKEYFRGIYFQAEDAETGTLMQLDFSKGDITLHYREYATLVDGVPAKYEDNDTDDYGGTPKLAAKTLVLNMRGNSVSLLETENSNLYAAGILNPNRIEGDSKLFLKGGEGSVAVIDLFGADNFGVDGLSGSPDGVADELNIIRRNGWLINEANLTFYVDQNQMGTAVAEPQRLYLYDLTNKRPLLDWVEDRSTNALQPRLSKSIHDGIIRTAEGRGVRYRVRITNHIRNLIRKDSTNVRLGVSVTESIGLITSVRLKSPKDISGVFPQSEDFKFDRIPSASLINPLGTIIYGNNIAPQSPDYKKRLKLEIYYTKPN
jgi:hypothetical protein